MPAIEPTCEICGHSDGNAVFEAREMTFGLRHTFDYFECVACGCVQIVAVPDNLGDYYPSEYFAFKPQHRLARSRLKATTERLRYRAARGESVIGGVLARFNKPLNYSGWTRAAGVGPEARVLDIGCGSGKLLVRMQNAGFRECVGVDPFVAETLHYANGVTIHARELEEFAAERDQPFDFIMMHHSLEHMPAQHKVLRSIASLLSPGGTLLVRIPVAGCYAWRTYRQDWVNLDPPRHLFLHTETSLARVAADVGLSVVESEYDSTSRQLTGSELWARDIPWLSDGPERAEVDARKTEFETRAAELNQARDGDMAAFYLKHAG